MHKNIQNFLQNTFLFQSIKDESFAKILSEIEPEIKTFSSKEIIYSPVDFEKKIGFVYHGECIVKQIGHGDGVALNTIGDGASFGIMAVLSDEDEFPTQIIAKRQTTVLFITKNDFYTVIKHYPTVAMNVIRFLSDKVTFLNRKIATFSSDTVEKKVARLILAEYKRCGELKFHFNCKRAGETVSASRVSIYRALNSLCEEKIINFENKNVEILNLDSLERIIL